ncbi:MAG: hypothetical protein M9962_07140 [Oligoflexia bacterium]|nr:hypothetical protein [Oligoflexia bacterium]
MKRRVFLFSFLTLLALNSCASLESVDRDLVNSPLMSFSEDTGEAPLTGLRGASSSGSSGCRVCAH